MSYCRWSSMDFACDLYCYESDEGYVTHVAANRVVGEVPHIDFNAAPEVMGEQIAAQHLYLKTAEHAPIGLPHDGETYTDGDLEDFQARLLQLREVGYIFPDYVLETIGEEMAEEEAEE